MQVIDRQDALRETSPPWVVAERLLALPQRFASTERPDRYLEEVASELAELLSATVTLYWHDDDTHLPVAEASDLLMAVSRNGVPYATLHLSRPDPFSERMRRLAGHVALDLGYVVDSISGRRARAALAELRAAVQGPGDLEVFAERAIELGVRHLGAEAGALLIARHGGFQAMATVGHWPLGNGGSTRLLDAASKGIGAQGALHHAGGLLTAPIAFGRPARCVVVMRFPADKPKHEISLPVLNEMIGAAAPYLEARWRDRVLSELLELNRSSEDTSSTELYDSVLDTALRLVPGAEGGTLLTRSSPNEPFRFQAAQGFDLAHLERRPLTEDECRTWYGADDHGWRHGLPRILSSAETDIGSYGVASTPGLDPEVTDYESIQSTLCLPVLRDGKVMAILNLDNLSDPRGLGNDSGQLAFLFGAPLASLLHRQQTRDLLYKAALTDDLTGLANRRAFDAALERELARFARGGPTPTVMLMDLKGFKAINDRFGHDVGDDALTAVARALESTVRAGDFPARRGGDEFVALLTDADAADVEAVGARIKAAVAALRFGDVDLSINVGSATAGVDGDDAAALLALADERMYQDKLGRR